MTNQSEEVKDEALATLAWLAGLADDEATREAHLTAISCLEVKWGRDSVESRLPADIKSFIEALSTRVLKNSENI